MDFLEYLTKLAPAGETALILRQKPTLRDGKIQYYDDGVPKATFPAFLPNHKRRDGESSSFQPFPNPDFSMATTRLCNA